MASRTWRRSRARREPNTETNFKRELLLHTGDGITDLEAVESTQGADLFIGYGGVVERKAVAAAAPWFVYSHDVLAEALQRQKVCVAVFMLRCELRLLMPT